MKRIVSNARVGCVLLLLFGAPFMPLSTRGQEAVQPSAAVEAPKEAPKEAPLTDADVIKLAKLELGDEVVIAKIKEAKTVAFATDVDSLTTLKAEGVSPAVITAMLQRNTAPPDPPKAAPAQEEKMVVEVKGISNFHFGPSDVVLCSTDGNYKLLSTQGSVSSTYAFVTVLLFSDFPGLHAGVRVKDAQPSVLIQSENSPAGRYYFVKAKSNKGDKTRSVKTGRMGWFNAKSMTVPDKDWTVDTFQTEEKPGVWRLSPAKKLEPGEYGLWVLGAQPEMYDFGVDK
jgi:hypothetical protein